MFSKTLLSIICGAGLVLAQPAYALERILSTEQSAQNSAQNTGATTVPMTAGAREAANLLGLMPYVEKLHAAKQNSSSEPGKMSDEHLGLKVHMLDKILEQSLEVRVVADRIDRELAWAYTGKGMLESRRQKRLNYLFTANFMQGGILGILSGPQFLMDHPTAGAELLLVASSVGLMLSSLALLESRSGTKKVDGGTTILADVYSLNTPDANQHNPAVVMKFLNSVPPGSIDKRTRKEVLIDAWKKGKYLRTDKEEHLHKLAAVTPPGTKYKEDINLLGARIRMLYDVQWTIEQLDAELLDLMRATN